MKTTEERFWPKVDKSGDCWLWAAYIHPNGYGFFHFDGKVGGAHRYAYELAHGPIPKGMQVDHICHTRSCVKPDHLRLATPKQNAENPAGVYTSNTSGAIGVHWDKRLCKWVAKVRHNHKLHYVGSFADKERAKQAVTAKRLELFTHNELDRKAVA